MRIAALDMGDVWIGVALSDSLGITARPLKTIPYNDLMLTIAELIKDHQVAVFVVGDPQTLKGTASEQTLKVRAQIDTLRAQFPEFEWVLWDERLTSKQAARIHKAHDKQGKLHQHAVAAALILHSYLDHIAWQKQKEEI